MMLKLQRYNLKVSYKRGKEMYIADLLSRTFNNNSQNSTNSKVEHFHIFYQDLGNINFTDYLNLSDKNILRLQKETPKDFLLNSLKDIVLSGWPDNLRDVPNDIRTFGVQNDIIYKRWKVIIPKSMQNEMLQKINKSHLGIAASIRKARDVMYWPNMSNDITSYVRSCTTCTEFSDAQETQPL